MKKESTRICKSLVHTFPELRDGPPWRWLFCVARCGPVCSETIRDTEGLPKPCSETGSKTLGLPAVSHLLLLQVLSAFPHWYIRDHGSTQLAVSIQVPVSWMWTTASASLALQYMSLLHTFSKTLRHLLILLF